MHSKSNRKKMIIALTAGFLAALGMFTSFNQKDAQEQKSINEVQILKNQMNKLSDNITIGISPISKDIAILAKQKIPVGTVLKAEMMESKQINPQLMPTNSLNNLYSLIGKISIKDINSGDFIKNSDIAENTYTEIDLPDGMRAISVPVAYLQGLASFIKKGSCVDIISTAKTSTEQPELILQNIKLISIDGATAGVTESNKATSLTFQIPASSSARIVNAMMSGKLLIVARNFTDKKIISKNYKERIHSSKSNSSININPLSANYKLPELPTLTKISPNGLPQPASPTASSSRKVELIQANVKSDVTFNSDY